ncbi:MAG: endonuclease V [Planctomycetota bacterium]|nr:MAG: endonuclease V [Planctomycetota bacterium]
MQPVRRHPWRVGYEQAVAIQQRLRAQLRLEPPARPPETVAGLDVAYSRRTHTLYAAAVVWRIAEARVLEVRHAIVPCRFPYIPGLFSFREIPALVAVLERLASRPDALVCDGHGIAHPRRFGLAAHLGLLFDVPCVGVAKKRLWGIELALGPERGEVAPLLDPHTAAPVGALVRTRSGVKPVFVSPGHRFDFDAAVELVLRCAGRFRLPEPTRRAHQETVRLLRTHDPKRPAVRERRYPDYVERQPGAAANA